MSTPDVDRSVTRSPISYERGPPSSSPSCSLSHSHISEALARSRDHGATLTFMKKNLTDIGAEAAEELATIGRTSAEDESPVERMALGSNRLTALPMEFALLSRLRYLNLKNNNFTVFPDVLTLMPTLDTLDMSHNKVRRLPTDPGKLVNLRVFCLSRNKLSKLPTYLTQFQNLAVLEVDRNPIEWPPKHILERPTALSADDMLGWIKKLQKWIETERVKPSRQQTDDSSIYGGDHSSNDLESSLEASFKSWQMLSISDTEPDAGVTPHARSFSVDSSFTSSSAADSDYEQPAPSTSTYQDRLPPLHLGMLHSSSTETSPTHSDSYLPSPADSESFFDIASGSQAPLQHMRNASYHDRTARAGKTSAHLSGKKSLPDLRTAKFNFAQAPELPSFESGATPIPFKGKSRDEFSMPSPLSQRQDSGSSLSSSIRFASKAGPSKESPPDQNRVPSMEFERTSYFRRLSKLPAASITSSLPPALLCLVDSARSILFAVCQIYQTLEHYTVDAIIDEGLSRVLKKVVDPASVQMRELINSLDQFDAMSQKTVPPPSFCRAVVESCKDAVSMFGKAVSVLALQVKVIAAGDDVRYLRTMLLQLYGAFAELTMAWQAMLPQIEAIKPHLRPTPSSGGKPFSPTTGMISIGSPDSDGPFGHWEAPGSAGLRSANTTNGRSKERRKAGSFSVRDLEIGAKLPSYEEPNPFMTRGLAVSSETPILRTPNRSNRATSITISTPQPPSPMMGIPVGTPGSMIESYMGGHSRTGSQTSLQASSSDSPPFQPSSGELPATVKAVDKEALQSIDVAVEVAHIVWSMVEDSLRNVLDTNPEVRDSLEKAKFLTKRLPATARAVQDGMADKSLLREDGYSFVKAIIEISSVLKRHVDGRFPALRTNLSKLGKATEQFTMLLHVSSFAPSVTSTNGRNFSPVILGSTPPQTNLLATVADDKLVSTGLSRSRSAQAAASAKVTPMAAPQDAPRSALPSQQSFNIPYRRIRNGVEVNDSG